MENKVISKSTVNMRIINPMNITKKIRIRIEIETNLLVTTDREMITDKGKSMMIEVMILMSIEDLEVVIEGNIEMIGIIHREVGEDMMVTISRGIIITRMRDIIVDHQEGPIDIGGEGR